MVQSLLPFNMKCWIAEKWINLNFDHGFYQLKPKHRYFSQHPTINDNLANRLLNGSVIIKSNIDTFTENGVKFCGESHETECDIVIMATGYRFSFPFISSQLIPIIDNNVELYKFMFHPHLKHPKTLAFISLVQPHGPLLPLGF